MGMSKKRWPAIGASVFPIPRLGRRRLLPVRAFKATALWRTLNSEQNLIGSYEMEWINLRVKSLVQFAARFAFPSPHNTLLTRPRSCDFPLRCCQLGLTVIKTGRKDGTAASRVGMKTIRFGLLMCWWMTDVARCGAHISRRPRLPISKCKSCVSGAQPKSLNRQYIAKQTFQVILTFDYCVRCAEVGGAKSAVCRRVVRMPSVPTRRRRRRQTRAGLAVSLPVMMEFSQRQRTRSYRYLSGKKLRRVRLNRMKRSEIEGECTNNVN
jgi:hypothetical protein